MRLGRWGRAYLAQRRSGQQPASVLQRSRAEYRRRVSDLMRAGFEPITENGGMLWELYRGNRYDHVIVDVRIGPDQKHVWVKVERAA